MTLPDLVQRVKYLDPPTSAKQIEKFVVELLGPPKRTDFFMIRVYRRQILARLKRARD